MPLIEKAYAKLYGCFAHLEGGYTREAIEDLTGFVPFLLRVPEVNISLMLAGSPLVCLLG